MPRVETANALDLSAFTRSYLPDNSPQLIFQNPQTAETYSITLHTSSSLPPNAFDTCFNLVASSSAADYSTSSVGWSPAKKRKEMRLPDLRYILVHPSTGTDVEAFLSFMLTYEDGHEVVYCYEIHVSPHLHGCGLGKHLMCLMEDVGTKARMEKAMLTVFVANKDALAFYKRLGYLMDEYSPEERKLRNGVVKKPDYVILSKALISPTEEPP